MSFQLELGLEIVTTQNIEWSYSRREVLEQCPRRYYYQYYGANARTAKKELQKESLASLKTLSNRHMRIGNILHLVIRAYFKKLQEGEVWTVDRLLRWAQKIYRQDREYSRTKSYESPPLSNADGPVPLLEFYYGFPEAEELYAESEQRLLEAIRNFMTSELFAPFRSGGRQVDAAIEKQIRLKIGNLTMRGQTDLAYPDSRGIVICDWKIGGTKGFDGSLQLLSYALWAVHQYQCQPSDITIYRAYLVEKQLSSSAVSDKNLQRARARIIQDVEKMQTLNVYGRNAVADAFTPCRHPRVCVLCPFPEVCPKEGYGVDD